LPIKKLDLAGVSVGGPWQGPQSQKVIVERGVDKGLGSVLLFEALTKNKEEGFDGRY
jgi:hypothetical protein